MNSVTIRRSRTGVPSVRVSTGSHPATTSLGLETGTREMVSTAASASTTVVSSDRTSSARRLSVRAEALRGVEVEPALPVQGTAPMPAEHHAEEKAADAGAADPGDPADPASVAAAPPPPAFRAEKIELTIESLQNYDLLQPIPVVVESIGDKIFVAEIPELDISTSGTSVSDTLILLKAHIGTVYDGLRIKKNLDSERTRQLRLLETYIGKPKRNWF